MGAGPLMQPVSACVALQGGPAPARLIPFLPALPHTERCEAQSACTCTASLPDLGPHARVPPGEPQPLQVGVLVEHVQDLRRGQRVRVCVGARGV